VANVKRQGGGPLIYYNQHQSVTELIVNIQFVMGVDERRVARY
jgi:hypothetical protein